MVSLSWAVIAGEWMREQAIGWQVEVTAEARQRLEIRSHHGCNRAFKRFGEIGRKQDRSPFK